MKNAFHKRKKVFRRNFSFVRFSRLVNFLWNVAPAHPDVKSAADALAAITLDALALSDFFNTLSRSFYKPFCLGKSAVFPGHSQLFLFGYNSHHGCCPADFKITPRDFFTWFPGEDLRYMLDAVRLYLAKPSSRPPFLWAVKRNTLSMGVGIFSMTDGGMNARPYRNFAKTWFARSVPLSDRRRRPFSFATRPELSRSASSS